MQPNGDTDGGDYKDFHKLKSDFSNWVVWIERVEDYLCAAKHYLADSMWEAAFWVPEEEDEVDPVLHFRNLPTNNKSEQEFKMVHRGAFGFIRQKLSNALFQKTVKMPHKTVPDLIRFLRTAWNDGSAIDRSRLRIEMEALRLEQFSNFEEYLTALEHKFSDLTDAGVKTYDDDEDKLHKLLASLDNTWRIHTATITANELNYAKAKAYLQKVAKSDSNITGTSVVASKQKTGGLRSTLHKNSEPSQRAGSSPSARAREEITANFHTATPTT